MVSWSQVGRDRWARRGSKGIRGARRAQRSRPTLITLVPSDCPIQTPSRSQKKPGPLRPREMSTANIVRTGLPARTNHHHLMKGSENTPVAIALLLCDVTAKPAYTSAPIAIVKVVTLFQVMPSVDEDAMKVLPLRSRRTQ